MGGAQAKGGGHRAFSVRLRCNTQSQPSPHDDRRQNGTSRTDPEEHRRRLPARHRRAHAAPADGLRGRRADRGFASRTQRRAVDLPQRLAAAPTGNPAGHARSEDPQVAPRLLLPGFPGAAQDGREGADRRHPGGLEPGRLDPQGRRPRPGPRHDGDLHVPGFGVVSGSEPTAPAGNGPKGH